MNILRRTVLPLFRWRVRASGLEHLPKEGGFLVIGNHQSYLDPPLVWLALTPALNQKLWFITTEYVWRGLTRVFGSRAIDWLGLLPVHSSDKAKVLDLALQELRRGGVVVVFPEGTRNRTGQPVLLKAKTGAARLALATGLPVVPVGIVAPPGLTKAQAIRNFFSLKPARVVVGKPLVFPPSEAVTKELLEQTSLTMMRAVGELCGKRVSP